MIADSGIPVSCRSKLLKSSICSFSFAVLPSAIVQIAPIMFIVEIIRKGLVPTSCHGEAYEKMGDFFNSISLLC